MQQLSFTTNHQPRVAKRLAQRCTDIGPTSARFNLLFEGWLSQSLTQTRKCLHFDEIIINGCTGSCQSDNFQCSQWWKFRQNDDIFVSVKQYNLTLYEINSARRSFLKKPCGKAAGHHIILYPGMWATVVQCCNEWEDFLPVYTRCGTYSFCKPLSDGHGSHEHRLGQAYRGAADEGAEHAVIQTQ